MVSGFLFQCTACFWGVGSWFVVRLCRRIFLSGLEFGGGSSSSFGEVCRQNEGAPLFKASQVIKSYLSKKSLCTSLFLPAARQGFPMAFIMEQAGGAASCGMFKGLAASELAF